MDLSALRVIVIDEVDFFFSDSRNQQEIEDLTRRTFNKLKQKIQWLMFSATYPEESIEEMKKFITEAQIVGLKTEKLDLDHVTQFVIQCPPKGKAEFLVEIYKLLTGTQSLIFVNTKDFVVPLRNILKRNQMNVTVTHGEMNPE